MTAPANGRLAPAAPPPERTAARTGRVGASLEALAEHLEAAAASVRALARDLQDELADPPDPRLMGAVTSPTATPAAGPELLTADDLADRLRVTSKTIRRWRFERRLPEAIEIAGVLRWRATDVDRWLAEAGA